jgi:GAF domain-containing protein
MTTLAPTPLLDGSLLGLHQALVPAEAYALLTEILKDRYGHAPRGAYVRASNGSFALDAQCPADGTLPDGFEPQTRPLPAHLKAVVYTYNGLPLGALALDRAVAAPAGELEQLLQEHFAPAFFRTCYLAQTLRDNALANEQIYFLTEIGRLLGTLELQPLLLNILELTSGYLEADVGSITLLSPVGEPATAVEFGLPLSALLSWQDEAGDAVLQAALRRGSPLHLRREQLRFSDAAAPRPDQLLILPLVSSNSTLGSINLVASTAAVGFSNKRMEVVRPAVGLAAVAVENALLLQVKLEREREQQQLLVAQQIQSRLLPQVPPRIAGIDLAGTSLPATTIGGDYYDFFALRDGALGMVVADVAGKGVPAGLIMTATRAMFRSAAHQHSRPERVLERVNRLLCEEGFGPNFVTAVCVRVELPSGKVTIASAGHEPALLLRARDGRLESTLLRSLPMGLRDSTRYPAARLQLQPGDALLLYSD